MYALDDLSLTPSHDDRNQSSSASIRVELKCIGVAASQDCSVDRANPEEGGGVNICKVLG
jgi:hypothetical protein